MSWIDNNFMGSLVFFVSLLFLVSLGAAEFQVYKGDSVTIQEANSTITWGQNYTFNASSLAVNNNALSLDDKNISIYSNNSAQINSTLWEYNLTGPYHNKTAIKLGVSAVNGTNVSIGFTSLPAFTFGRYELARSGSLIQEFTSGGEITWYETNWSTYNYTVTYYNDTENPVLSLSLETGSVTDGSHIKISCSASDTSGIKSSSLKVVDPNGDSYNLGCGQEFEETYLTGEYTVRFSATDKAGNTNSVKKTFDVSSSGGGGGGGSSGGGGSGGSSFGSAGISDSNTWISTNTKRFTFKNIDQEVGVRSVAVSTDRNMSSFSLSVTRLNEKPSLPELPENTYRFYEFTAKNEEEISSTEIEFSVDRSFAERYNEVVVSHYSDGWEDLDTTKIESNGEEWVYEATASGFSYFAVRGVDRDSGEKQNGSGTGNQTSQDQNETGPVCGDQTCNTDEDWKSCNADCQKPQTVINAENAILNAEEQISKDDPGYQELQQAKTQFEKGEYSEAERLAQNALEQQQNKQRSDRLPLIDTAVAALILLAVTGFVGYRRWIDHRIDQEIQKIREKVRQTDGEVSSAGRVKNELDRAEKALEMDKRRQAKRALDRIEELLNQ